MPVETLRPSGGRLPVGPAPFASAMPFRILNKGPGYFRRPAEPGGARRPSAVERLEADKAKYVKSQQVALTRQAPVIRKPLLSPAAMLQCRIAAPTARKTPPRPAPSGSENDGGGGGRRGPHLNLEILNNLINDVCCERPSSPASGSAPSGSSPSGSSPSASGAKSVGGSSLSAEPEGSARRLLLHLRPGDHHHHHHATASSSTSSCASSSSPLNSARCHAPPDLPPLPPAGGRPPPVPARGLRAGPAAAAAPGGAPSSVTVRRVDVRPPQAEEVRKPQRRPQLPPKPPPKPPAPAPAPPRQTAQPQAPPPPAPPARLPYPPPSPMLLRAALKPPASPAFTRLSSASSRGSRAGSRQRPSLHRSKSDLSDRYSRATADLERFFNYCGLDAPEVDALGGVERFARGGATSDIISVSRLRSVSTPSSECGGGERGEEEEEDVAAVAAAARGAGERVPYGISVIERNARVIKWLYGLRQAKDGAAGVSNV